MKDEGAEGSNADAVTEGGAADEVTAGDRPLRPTMTDVAAAAGVSQTTVSLVLNEVAGARLSDATRERVHAAVERLGYRFVARRSARPRPATTRTIGFIADEFSTDPWCAVGLDGAQAKAWDLGAEITVAITRGTPDMAESALAMMVRQKVDALIVATIQTREIDPLPVPPGIPVVLLNCYDAARMLPSVVPDEFGGGYAGDQAPDRGRCPSDCPYPRSGLDGCDQRPAARLPEGA